MTTLRRGMGLEIVKSDPSTVTVLTAPCPECEQRSVLTVRADGFWSWQKDTFIQDALPELSIADRELLISGTHDACFKVLFPEDRDWHGKWS